jgi:hypothetical protein
LDGLESKYPLEGVFEYGSAGFKGPGPWGASNMTNAEFYSIYTNPNYFFKTQFFFKGDGPLYVPQPPPRPFGWHPTPNQFTFK